MSERQEVYDLIERHYRTHRNNSVSKLSNQLGKAQAEDVVQEAYTRALKYWKSYDLSHGFDQWMAGIFGNCIKDHKKDTVLNGLVQEDLIALPEPARFDMTDHLMAREVAATIDALPRLMRFVMKLYLIEGYTSKEISEIIEVSPEAIRKMVSRFKESYAQA